MTLPPGVAAERTDLAWQRTGLGVLAVAGLLGHRALVSGRVLLLVAAGITALLGLGTLGALVPIRARQARRWSAAGSDVAAPVLAAAATAAVVLVGIAAAVAIVMPR